MKTVVRLPFPPSVNNLFINVRRGRVPSQRYEDWRQAAGLELKQQQPWKVTGPVKITYEFAQPDKRKRDLSNLIKAPEDLIVSYGLIEGDDSSVVKEFTATWADGFKGCRVTIEKLSESFSV